MRSLRHLHLAVAPEPVGAKDGEESIAAAQHSIVLHSRAVRHRSGAGGVVRHGGSSRKENIIKSLALPLVVLYEAFYYSILHCGAVGRVRGREGVGDGVIADAKVGRRVTGAPVAPAGARTYHLSSGVVALQMASSVGVDSLGVVQCSAGSGAKCGMVRVSEMTAQRLNSA